MLIDALFKSDDKCCENILRFIYYEIHENVVDTDRESKLQVFYPEFNQYLQSIVCTKCKKKAYKRKEKQEKDSNICIDCDGTFFTCKGIINSMFIHEIQKFSKNGRDWDYIAKLVLKLQDSDLMLQAMITAVLYSEKAYIQMFLDAGCSVNARSEWMWLKDLTPFLAACGSGSKETIQLLLLANGNVNAKDQNGNTPLHHVAMNTPQRKKQEMFDILELLIESGAEKLSENVLKEKPINFVLLRIDDPAYDMDAVKLLLDNEKPFQNYEYELRNITSLSLCAHVYSIANFVFKQDKGAVVAPGTKRFMWFSATISQMFLNNIYHRSLLHRMSEEQFCATSDLVLNLEAILGNQHVMSVAQRLLFKDILQTSWHTLWDCDFRNETLYEMWNTERLNRKIAVCMSLVRRLGHNSSLAKLKYDNIMKICEYV